MSYEYIKELQRVIKRERGRKPPLTDLLVLTPECDPYYAGGPPERASRRDAEWFAAIWEQFGFSTGTHLRRIHYRIVAEGYMRRGDGVPYENDTNSWQHLLRASRRARYLGLVDPEDIVDKRNPDPDIYLVPPEWWEETEPGWSYDFEDWHLPTIDPDTLSGALDAITPPELHATGYAYRETMQPYHVEVWAEKTTMDDILKPLCQQTATNYISGAGYQSITAMVALLRQRVPRLEKPCRVLYISDFDAAGQNMPHQMARQMQFWIERYATDCDIRVEPIVLTAEQAKDYPAAPDTGAVELDAMEALDPGRLARIVRENISQFRDGRLRRRVGATYHAAQSALEEAFEEAAGGELEELEAIKAEADEVYERYRSRLEDLGTQLEGDLAPLRERLETLSRACNATFARRPRAAVAIPARAGNVAG